MEYIPNLLDMIIRNAQKADINMCNIASTKLKEGSNMLLQFYHLSSLDRILERIMGIPF